MGLGNVGNIDFELTHRALASANDPWYNGEIQLIDPDIKGSGFDRVANTKDRTYQVVWQGKARFMAMRWPNVATTRQEAVSIRTVVFSIPRNDENPIPQFVPEGHRIRVLSGGNSPEFQVGLFVVTSSVNSSYDWYRRIETMHDQGAAVEWA